jgi:2-polyprenyl-3-methyl-5-hydroxy-6-metoxy-1,4-benzoquinol methylase
MSKQGTDTHRKSGSPSSKTPAKLKDFQLPEFMNDGVEREYARIKEKGEIFTPDYLVDEMLDTLSINWKNIPDEDFLDPTCGNGQFLIGLAKRGVPLKNLYGVDIMKDNVEITKKRLLNFFGDTEENRTIIENNIVQADALEYDYNFNEIVLDEW